MLLEATDLNIDEIARESGFGHSVLLRHHFAKVLDTSPQSYRRTFRGSDKGCDLDLHDLEEQFGGHSLSR